MAHLPEDKDVRSQKPIIHPPSPGIELHYGQIFDSVGTSNEVD